VDAFDSIEGGQGQGIGRLLFPAMGGYKTDGLGRRLGGTECSGVRIEPN
jgi:hypothetical protein